MALAHSEERKARGQQTKITDIFHIYIYIYTVITYNQRNSIETS